MPKVDLQVPNYTAVASNHVCLQYENGVRGTYAYVRLMHLFTHERNGEIWRNLILMHRYLILIMHRFRSLEIANRDRSQ